MPGTTPVYGFPYPEPTDLVADYPALGQQLAEDVETELAASGKLLQIVRDTDTTNRATTSTTFTDITGVSVTITPKKSTSSILVIATFFAYVNATASGHRSRYQITDSSNVALSGAEDAYWGSANSQQQMQSGMTLIGYATPGVTTAVTYKMRFAATNAASQAECAGNLMTTQLYAIEVTL